MTMAVDSKRCPQYQTEGVDVLDRPVSSDFVSAYPTTFKELTAKLHVFLGRFADESEAELNHLALARDCTKIMAHSHCVTEVFHVVHAIERGLQTNARSIRRSTS